MSNKSNVKSVKLSYYERQKIEYYLRLRMSKRAIARRLKRDSSVIIREVKRNSTSDGEYIADIAQEKADKKAKITNKRRLETNDDLRRYVENKLKHGWSPEQISGRLKDHTPPYLKGVYINHESIYDYIYNGNGKHLYYCLRRSKKKRQKRMYRKKQQKNTIKQRVSIHDRPEIINEKERYGDWESDLIVFKKQREVVSVQYERKGMLTRIHRVLSKEAEENEQAICKTLESIPSELHKSITFDNGGENVCHISLRDNFNIFTYFCDTYSSWQKGGVENLNGLIRQYLPKNADMSKITDEDIYAIQELLNNRPRKALNYQTPSEVINKNFQLNNLTSDALNS